MNNWGDYNWKNYDAIHFFGPGEWSIGLMSAIGTINAHVFYSPIIDPFLFNRKKEKIKLKLAMKSGFRYQTPFCSEMHSLKSANHILVRSSYEKDYVQEMYDIEDNRISVVPLSVSSAIEKASSSIDLASFSSDRENFVLHISSIYQPRKNVIRLIRAAKKYKFKLILAGNPGSEKDMALLKQEIGDYSDIKILGFISEERKMELYSKAKVFALPSICEGVGIVAVDAAYCGCDIVITNDGGPKEYYNHLALEVSPYDIDDIGQACCRLLGEETFQPELSSHIRQYYSGEKIAQLLESVYKQL